MRRAAPSPRPARPARSVPYLRVVVGVLAGVLMLMIVQFAHRVHDMTRGSPVRTFRATPAGPAPSVRDPGFPTAVAALAGAPLRGGHELEVFTAGRTSFGRMFADLRAARRSISFQSYYCGAGSVADTLVSILEERARAGVQVRVLADGFACRHLGRREAGRLRAAGAAVATLRPVRWTTLHKAQHRSHVRLAIVDGDVAHTGGFGIDDKWLEAHGAGWRDTNVRFTGPAVAQAQAAFLAGWAEATGELLAGSDLFPAAAVVGAADEAGDPARVDDHAVSEGAVAAVQYGTPGIGTTVFERLLFLSVAGARHRLYITNAYFVPTAPLRALLVDAVRRGVDVRVLTAGRHNDVPSTLFAARAYYDELLSAGVRVYEYIPTMMHAKTLVVDGTWTAIGGMNFDNRSLRLNDELNLLILDAATGRLMDDIFLVDLQRAREVTLRVHRARPWTDRGLEWGVRLLAPLL